MKRIIVGMLSFVFRGWFRVRYFGKVKFGRGVVMNWRFKFRGRGCLEVGDGCNLWAHEEWNRFFTYDKGAVVRVGAGTRLNGVTVQCRRGVEVGERCLIGSAMLIDNDFHSVDWRYRNDSAHVKSAAILVGDDVWIGGQAVLLKGVHVGGKAVVGFRAVVTKDVPEKAVVAGNPARVVKTLI
jgi:hypothetical protein